MIAFSPEGLWELEDRVKKLEKQIAVLINAMTDDGK